MDSLLLVIRLFKVLFFIFEYKFLDINTYGKSLNINHIKPKSIFGKFENLNDSKLNLKNSNRNNIPIITINYVEKNE